MVKQGDIILLNFNPQSGHEQPGNRPALVVSNNTYNEYMNRAIVCPITNTDRDFGFQVKLDARTKTAGIIMCEQLKALDITSRGYKYIEQIPSDLLEDCLDRTTAMLERD